MENFPVTDRQLMIEMSPRRSTAAYQREWRAKRKQKGLPVHSPARLAKQREWLAETYHTLRQSLYGIVGRVCIGCGHDDVRVMEFDHIADNGAADRRRFKGARSMLEYYVSRPDEARANLQTLCRNCNWLKRKGQSLPTAVAVAAPQKGAAHAG